MIQILTMNNKTTIQKKKSPTGARKAMMNTGQVANLIKPFLSNYHINFPIISINNILAPYNIKHPHITNNKLTKNI